MTPLELLEATKAQVDLRWAPSSPLWDMYSDPEVIHACLLGCLGFARWGGDFIEGWQQQGYNRLKRDSSTSEAISQLAKHSRFIDIGGDFLPPAMESVWRHNDRHLFTKKDAKAFIDLAIADLKSS